jgi:hypothetical protein
MTHALALPGLPPETDGGGDTIEGFSLDEAARFAAQLSVARLRAEALARRGVDEATWALAEVGWMTRIARKAFAGDPSLLEAYRAAGDDELALLGASRPVPPREIWLRSEELRASGKTDGQIARALDLPVFDLARMRLAHARAGA